MITLFDPIQLGDYQLPNRVIMAPLTRGRAGTMGIPSSDMAEYYAQRAEAGLIISEAVAISAEGRGWLNSPGIYTDEHMRGWRRVAGAVHEEGGRIFMQIWHMGALVHPDFHEGRLPVSASDVRLEGQLKTPDDKAKEMVRPRPLSRDEIADRVADFRQAAIRAVEAGMDGVEIHGANGFLIDQFTRDATNRRTDGYGGTPEKRARFLVEVTGAVCEAIGAGRVGLRLSPTNKPWGISDSDPRATFTKVAELLNPFGLAYLHILEPKPGSGHGMAPDGPAAGPSMRKAYKGLLVANGGYDHEKGNEDLQAGAVDAVAYGSPFIANPDLVTRFRLNAELAEADRSTFYTPGPQGYTDYARLEPQASR